VHPAEAAISHVRAPVVFLFNNDPFELELMEGEATDLEFVEFTFSEKEGQPVRLVEESKRMAGGKRVVDVVTETQTAKQEQIARTMRARDLMGLVSPGTTVPSVLLAPPTTSSFAASESV
jgi:hypothetical protein